MGMDNGAQDAANAQVEAAEQAGQQYAEQAQKAVDYAQQQYGQGRNDLTGYYGKGQGYLDPYIGAGRSGLNAYLAGLGLGGSDAANNLYSQFKNSPGYQAGIAEGQRAIERSNAAKGTTQSGALLKRLSRYGQDYADQKYGQFMDRLGNLAGMGAQASSQASGNAMNTGSNLAGLGQAYTGMIGDYYTGMGENYANSTLAAGNARAQGYLNQSNPWAGIGSVVGTVMGGPFGTAAGNKIGSAAGQWLFGG